MTNAGYQPHCADVIVFVGDAVSAARSLARALERLGYATAEAASVRDLATRAHRPLVAVVVSAGAGADPFRVVRTIRSLRGLAHALVFVWTRPELGGAVGPAIAAGADDVLVEGGELSDAVERITGRIVRNRTLCERATFDCVTQTRGRLFVEESLTAEIAHALRHHPQAALAVLWMCGFAASRAELGLATSEREIGNVAFVLARGLRSSDLACRVADDTFVVLLPGLGVADAAPVVAAARSRMLTKAPTTGDVLTGFAQAPRDGVTWEVLFDCAERKLVRPLAHAQPAGPPSSLRRTRDIA